MNKMTKTPKNDMEDKLILSMQIVVAVGMIFIAGCDVDNSIIRHKEGGLHIVFNGESVDGIQALCDLSKGSSENFNNYEFFTYFYVDLHSTLVKNHMRKGITIPHFNSGTFQCKTFEGRSSIDVYFYFTEDLSNDAVSDILQDFKSDLEERKYIETVEVLDKMRVIKQVQNG
jgi:hypothetical protein